MQRNAESALKSYERQAADALEAQKKGENKMALTMVELKQEKRQLEAKEAEMSQAEQVAYDAGMTKAAESLTTQLRDVARAFCLEVWGQALNAARVDANSELRAPEKVYYPPALHLPPTLPPPQADTGLVPPSSLDQPTSALSIVNPQDQEHGQSEETPVVDVEKDETAEVAKSKKRKKEKDHEKRGKGKEALA